MKQIALPNGRVTTQLGFGCGSLHGGVFARRSRALLEIAFEAGFRHFDVAPSYGLGLAENVVGDVMRCVRDEVTITTKGGLARPRRPQFFTAVRAVVNPLFGKTPGWSIAARTARTLVAPAVNFDVDSINRSLHESLARLNTHRVDCFLLHELRRSEISPALVEMLVGRKSEGLIGAIGIGTSRQQARNIAAEYPTVGQVQQFSWSVMEPRLEISQAKLDITHGVIVPAIQMLTDRLAVAPLRAEWSRELDADLADLNVLSDLLLAAALAENPHGLVLVASHRPERIKRFARVAKDSQLLSKGTAFRDFVSRQFATLSA